MTHPKEDGSEVLEARLPPCLLPLQPEELVSGPRPRPTLKPIPYFLVHVQHLLRLARVCSDPVDLILTDQDPVLLDDVEGADVAFDGVTSTSRQVASQLLDEHGVSRDLTRGWGAVLLPERHKERIVVGESNAKNRGHRKFGGVHVGIVPCVSAKVKWRVDFF